MIVQLQLAYTTDGINLQWVVVSAYNHQCSRLRALMSLCDRYFRLESMLHNAGNHWVLDDTSFKRRSPYNRVLGVRMIAPIGRSDFFDTLQEYVPYACPESTLAPLPVRGADVAFQSLDQLQRLIPIESPPETLRSTIEATESKPKAKQPRNSKGQFGKVES